METEKNPIIELVHLTQKMYHAPITTRVIGKSGADHAPVIDVEICLPDGRSFQASGKNKREAKQRAANEAIINFHKIKIDEK